MGTNYKEIQAYGIGHSSAFIGFETFAEAEAFAEKNNGEVASFKKRDGSHFWDYRGCAFEEFELTAEDFVGGYNVHDSKADYIEFYKNRMEDFDEETAETLRENFEENVDKVPELKEDEAIIEFEDGSLESFKVHTMSYNFDVYSFAIGVIVPEEE